MQVIDLPLDRAGEALVAAWCRDRRLEVLAERWHCRWGELDLMTQEDSALRFIEVKTRRQTGWDQSGLLAIGPAKQRCLSRAAACYLASLGNQAAVACRFDVALVRYRSEPSAAAVKVAAWGQGYLELWCYLPDAFSAVESGW